jgi:hypothetical protein
MSFLLKNEFTDTDGNVTVLEESVVPFWALDAAGVTVTLLVVKGLLTLEEGANTLHLSQEHLISEAQAWAVAGSN